MTRRWCRYNPICIFIFCFEFPVNQIREANLRTTAIIIVILCVISTIWNIPLLKIETKLHVRTCVSLNFCRESGAYQFGRNFQLSALFFNSFIYLPLEGSKMFSDVLHCLLFVATVCAIHILMLERVYYSQIDIKFHGEWNITKWIWFIWSVRRIQNFKLSMLYC